MKRSNSRAWLVIEPAIGVAVGVFIGWQWFRGAAAHLRSKL